MAWERKRLMPHKIAILQVTHLADTSRSRGWRFGDAFGDDLPGEAIVTGVDPVFGDAAMIAILAGAGCE
jgi:hypothetical protein